MAELTVKTRQVERIEYDEVAVFHLSLSREEIEGIQTLLWYGVTGHVLTRLKINGVLDAINDEIGEPEAYSSPFTGIAKVAD